MSKLTGGKNSGREKTRDSHQRDGVVYRTVRCVQIECFYEYVLVVHFPVSTVALVKLLAS